MQARLGLSLSLVALSVSAFAGTDYLSLTLQGKKVGWASYAAEQAQLDGVSVTKGVSKTLIDTNLMGTPLKMVVDSTTWSLPSGAPKRMTFKVSSGGIDQSGDAVFGEKSVKIAVVNAGKKSNLVLPRPKGLVVDDPLTLALSKGMNTTTAFWVLDPMTISFVRNEVKPLGPKMVDGKTVNVVRILDPRAWTDIYVSSKGDFIKATNALGFEMVPASREEAMSAAPESASGTPDIADLNKVVPIGEIPNERETSYLKLRMTGDDVPTLATDAHQTATREGDALILEVHPVRFDPTATRTSVAGQQAEFLKPSLNLPSDRDRFVKLASKITAGQKTVRGTAVSIQRWVNGQMIPNAGMGVVRDAEQVLDSKEGVCRDYAVLTTTLLRSAGIPARLASGLIYGEGAFYYHAWAEAWDGKNWVGVDSTLPEEKMSAVHLKLADGNVDSAFTFSFLGKAKFEVLEVH
ncbi:hypothetical protein BH11ARM2_BH11ARM2_11680 [soil metagenome]